MSLYSLKPKKNYKPNKNPIKKTKKNKTKIKN